MWWLISSSLIQILLSCCGALIHSSTLLSTLFSADSHLGDSESPPPTSKQHFRSYLNMKYCFKIVSSRLPHAPPEKNRLIKNTLNNLSEPMMMSHQVSWYFTLLVLICNHSIEVDEAYRCGQNLSSQEALNSPSTIDMGWRASVGQCPMWRRARPRSSPST